MPIRVLVVEDQPMMRDAMCAYIRAADDMDCIGEAGDGPRAVVMAAEREPDVVLLDIGLPQKNGVQVAYEVTQANPLVGVLGVTTFSTANHVVSMLRAGARGYILKEATAAEMLAAIRDVASGDVALSPAITQQLVDDVAEDATAIADSLAKQVQLPQVPESQLTVLRLLGRGMNYAEIAAELYFEVDTVKKYVGRLNKRFGTRDRVQLLIKATQLGFIKPQL